MIEVFKNVYTRRNAEKERRNNLSKFERASEDFDRAAKWFKFFLAVAAVIAALYIFVIILYLTAIIIK